MARPRQWELPALDPTDPSGSGRVTCWIDQATIERLTQFNLTARWFRILCVKDVLVEPVAVFEGWNREGFDDARCYVGRPDDRPKDGIELPPPPDKYFMAFVLPSGKIEEWGWERFNPESDADCRNQFGEGWRRVWPHEQTS